MRDLLLLAIGAAFSAGDEILRVYDAGFEVELKDDKSPLTIADKNAHEVICRSLLTSEIPVLSEEGKEIPFAERKRWKEFWMVDPLDGTKEFIKRNGEFTVNIALIRGHRPVLGVVFVPVTKVMYFAAEGIGSYKLTISDGVGDDLDGLISAAVRLPAQAGKRLFTVVASRSHLSTETEMFIDGLKKTNGDLKFISSGSSIKLCLVAEGTADIYPRFAPTMEWDTAAGQAVCEIAGRTVTDYDEGLPLQYNKENLLNPWFIVK